MNLKALLLLQPGFPIRAGILLSCLLITLLVGYLHTLTGLAYEFHVFFILPILVVSWFNGKRLGYVVAVLATLEWFIADRSLSGDQADGLPLIFNTTMRLAIFLYGVWLISEVRRVLLRESRMAREDALTQLPNRREFLERGLQAFAQAQRQGASFTAVLIDLDRFKVINDTLGHPAGDELLRGAAARFIRSVREGDTIARMGGDEFAILLSSS